MSPTWRIGDRVERVRLLELRADGARVQVGERTISLRFARAADGSYDLDQGDRFLRVHVLRDGAGAVWIHDGRRALRADPEDSVRGGAGGGPEGGGEVRAPMHGTVVAVLVGPGDAVAAGAPLLVLEAMKMEQTLEAPVAGTVGALGISAGDQVEQGALLLQIDPEAGAGAPEDDP